MISDPHQPHFAERLRLGWRDGRAVEFALPEADVDPAAVLVADLAVHARAAEAGGFVQPDRSLVGQRDDADRLGEALGTEGVDQRFVEKPPDAVPLDRAVT